jgi:thiamine pyrophosphate-dependent acetolactate synthase large subunit-like protein
MTRIPGYQAIPELLRQRRLTTVFAMIAETNGPWLGHGVEHGLISMVRTRHEETAVMAANGYARSTGGIGVASVTRGPGFANSINALAAAVDTHVPLILFTGAGPRIAAQTQNLEQEGIARLLGAGYLVVRSAEELAGSLDLAIERAAWRGHPQVVSIVDSVLDDETDIADHTPIARSRTVPDANAVVQIVELLSRAERPLIIGGHGALAANAREPLERIAERTGAALGSTLMSIRMFSGHPHDLGLVGGWAPRAARDYYQSVDAVVAFGATLNRFTLDRGRLFAGARIAQVLLDPADAGSFQRPELLAIGDAGSTAEMIAAELERRGDADRPYQGPSFGSVRDSLVAADAGSWHGAGLDVRAVAARLDALLPQDRIVVTDAGRAVVPLPDLVGARDGRSWLHGRGYGSIGQGLGLAIGAATAHPDRTVALFVGDGAFLSSCHDLDAVRLAGLRNLIVVVLNDERYGMESTTMARYGLPPDSISQSTPDLVALARVYGGDGIRVDDEAQLARLEIPAGQGLYVIDARIDGELDPLLTVGAGAAPR